MTLRAVIFDLYGTLVFDRFSSKKFPPFQSGQASLLGLPETEFAGLWQSSYLERISGRFPTYRENFLWIGETLGRRLDPSHLEEAARNLVEFTRQSLAPRKGALEVLRRLRGMGVATGLLSDCGPACPLLWEETAMSKLIDAVAFSCAERTRKPDPVFYRTLLDRLGLPARQCLYVGDGHGRELEGARQAGMKPALIPSAIDPGEPERLVLRDWDGITLSSLAEVPEGLG